MVSRLLAWVEITRPHNMLAAGLCVAAGYHVAGGGHAGVAFDGALVAALVTGAGNVINDVYDQDIDRVNKPRRPLPSTRLSRRSALWLYALLAAASLGAGFVLLPRAVAALVVVWHAALFAYAAVLKRVFAAGNLLVAAVTSSAFVAGAMLAGNVAEASVPFVIAFFFVLSREVVKGAEDVPGDSGGGVSTLAVVVGTARAAEVAAMIMLALTAVLPLPALLGFYGPEYFWTMAFFVVPGLLGGAYMMLTRPGGRTFTRVSWILKAGMFFGILAIAMGHA